MERGHRRKLRLKHVWCSESFLWFSRICSGFQLFSNINLHKNTKSHPSTCYCHKLLPVHSSPVKSTGSTERWVFFGIGMFGRGSKFKLGYDVSDHSRGRSAFNLTGSEFLTWFLGPLKSSCSGNGRIHTSLKLSWVKSLLWTNTSCIIHLSHPALNCSRNTTPDVQPAWNNTVQVSGLQYVECFLASQ